MTVVLLIVPGGGPTPAHRHPLTTLPNQRRNTRHRVIAGGGPNVWAMLREPSNIGGHPPGSRYDGDLLIAASTSFTVTSGVRLIVRVPLELIISDSAVRWRRREVRRSRRGRFPRMRSTCSRDQSIFPPTDLKAASAASRRLEPPSFMSTRRAASIHTSSRPIAAGGHASSRTHTRTALPSTIFAVVSMAWTLARMWAPCRRILRPRSAHRRILLISRLARDVGPTDVLARRHRFVGGTDRANLCGPAAQTAISVRRALIVLVRGAELLTESGEAALERVAETEADIAGVLADGVVAHRVP